MDLETYSRRQRTISRRLIQAVIQLIRPFQAPKIDDSQWEALLRALFRLIDESRRSSSQLAREFFDAQWAAHRDEEPPALEMPSYFEEYLREALQPVQRKFQQADAPPSAVTDIAELAMKETENAGRRTLMRAVEDTPEVLGYARVLTGLENCAFCVMLASRGPVYRSRESAGDPEMRVFHKGCDCKVVPVFNTQDWPGRAQYKELAQLWRDATRGYSGKNALNALRRHLADTDSGTGDASRFRAA